MIGLRYAYPDYPLDAHGTILFEGGVTMKRYGDLDERLDEAERLAKLVRARISLNTRRSEDGG